MRTARDKLFNCDLCSTETASRSKLEFNSIKIMAPTTLAYDSIESIFASVFRRIINNNYYTIIQRTYFGCRVPLRLLVFN